MDFVMIRVKIIMEMNGMIVIFIVLGEGEMLGVI